MLARLRERRADVLIVAAGSPRLIRAEHVRENRAALDLALSRADLAELDAAFPPPQGPNKLDVL